MKKAAVFALLVLLLAPSAASAAWWNPFSWKKGTSTPVISADMATSSTTPLALPTVDDLYKRIAELEQKLEDARERLLEAKVETKVAKVVSAPSLSIDSITTKVKPAVVLVETATTSAAGTIIDAQGHILTSVRAVLVKDKSGRVMGAASELTITLASGDKKKATLIGLDEASDIAVLRLVDGKSSAYVSLDYGTNAAVGDKVYVFGFSGPGANGGSTFTSGVIASKTSTSIQATTEDKNLDNGGAMVTSGGKLVGIPGIATCKVLEEMRTCLKYTVGANIVSAKMTKVLAGMKLYKNKTNRTTEESLFNGYLVNISETIRSASVISHAIDSVTGKNSFDYFNTKFGSGEEEKLAKIYLLKLKAAAQDFYLSFEFLRSNAYSLRTSLINDETAMAKLDGYQYKIIKQVQADNEARLKDYTAKVDYWSKKKNEYDSYILRPYDATSDYLMAEGVTVEGGAETLKKERSKVAESLSGETLDIF